MTHTREEIQEVLDKWRDGKFILPFSMPKTVLQIEEVLTWYYGVGGYTKADVETAKSILEELKGQTWKEITKKRPPTIAEQIVYMVQDGNKEILLFTNHKTESYAQIPKGEHIEILRIHGRAFKEYLTYQYQGMTQRVPNSNALRDAINSLSAFATHEGPRYRLHNRVAWHDNAIWYDLSNDKWQVVRIDENGWEILPRTPIPLFRRFDHHIPQVFPIRDKRRTRTRLWPLMKFHNHADVRNRILDLVSLAFYLVPGVPHPASIVYGPAGSGKTLGLHRTVKLLIDPSSVDQGLSFPRKKGDIPLQLERHYLIIYSNLSKLEGWQSDVLCRTIDGAADETRKLYTDAEIQAFQYLRCVGINAIPLVAIREDLLDRSILFPLESIPREKRMDEEELFESFEQLRPMMLGALFDTLSAAMKIRPTVQLGYIERLGAFTKWGYAIAQALDYDPERFLRNYAANRQQANEEIISSHVLSNVVMEFMRSRSEWMGAPRTLFTDLTEFEFGNKTPHKDWPKDAMRMSKDLDNLAQPLDRSGLEYKRGRLHDGRWISFVWHEGYGPKTVQKVLELDERPSGAVKAQSGDAMTPVTPHISVSSKSDKKNGGRHRDRNQASRATHATRALSAKFGDQKPAKAEIKKTADKISLRLQMIWKHAGLENIDDFLLDKDMERLPKSDRGFLTAQIDKGHVVQEKIGRWVLSETVREALRGVDSK